MARASWDEYFMDIATVVSSRSTCERKHVGAVIVRDRTILSTGYNGSIRGMPHCSEVGHMIEGNHCIATIHAEQNAIIHAAKNGVSINGAQLYVTASPCWSCFKSIANAGILRIVYGEFYRDDRIFSVAQRLGIELLHMPRHAAPPAGLGEPAPAAANLLNSAPEARPIAQPAQPPAPSIDAPAAGPDSDVDL
jgi:dCMP deaminase